MGEDYRMKETSENGQQHPNSKYTEEQFLKAIPGSYGSLTEIARRVGCSWDTAARYCKDAEQYPVAHEAWIKEGRLSHLAPRGGHPEGANLYTEQDFLEAIPGSGGIISTIANRVGCTWKTADKFCKSSEYPNAHDLWLAEREGLKDQSESLVLTNIMLGRKIQSNSKLSDEQRIVDSGDARWVLSRLGRDRGYGDKLDIEGDVKGKFDIEGLDPIDDLVRAMMEVKFREEAASAKREAKD
jgi:hypothetical protein